jgi:hypothetical protein
MTKNTTVSGRFDEFGRRHPRLMWLAIEILTLFVALVLLTTTEAPVVLYQAF